MSHNFTDKLAVYNKYCYEINEYCNSNDAFLGNSILILLSILWGILGTISIVFIISIIVYSIRECLGLNYPNAYR